jgi:hypothetical protein
MFDYLIEKIKNGQYNETLKSIVDLHTLDSFFTQEHYQKISKDALKFVKFAEENNPIDGEEPTIVSFNDIRQSNSNDDYFYDQLIGFFKKQSTIKTMFGKVGFTSKQADDLVNVAISRVSLHTDYPQQSDNKHTDQKNNLFTLTLQIYLPDDDSVQDYGTQFYNSKNEKIYNTKFLPNSGYLMISNNNAWHKSINGVFRKSILVRYSIPFDFFTSLHFTHHEDAAETFPIVFNRNNNNDTCSIVWNKDMGVFKKITDWFANMTFHNCIELGFENLLVANTPYKSELYCLRTLKNTYGFKKAFIFFGGFEWKNKEVYEYAVNLDMKDKVIAGLLDEDQFLRQCVIINLDKLDELDIDDAHGDGGFFERFIGRHISIEDMWLPRTYYHPEEDEENIVRNCLSNSNDIDNFPKLEYIKKHQTKTTLQQYQKAIENITYAPYTDYFFYLNKHFDNLKPIIETQEKIKAFTLNDFFSKEDYPRMAQDVIDAKPWTSKSAPIEGPEPSIITFDTFRNHETFYKRLWQYFSTLKVKRKVLQAFGHGEDTVEILKCSIQSMSYHTEYPHQIDNAHSDQKFSLSTYTIQIYLPQDDSVQDYGTQFVNNNNEVLYENKFLPNQGYFMESNNNSWHKPIMGAERKSLLIRYTIEMDFIKTKRVFNWDRTSKHCHIVYNKRFDNVHPKITDWMAIASLQNLQEFDIKNIVATSELPDTLKYLKKLGYTHIAIYNGGHIFTDSNIQQYTVPIEDIDMQNVGIIIGNNVSYYEPNKNDAHQILYYIQNNKGVESIDHKLGKKLEYIKHYRNNYTSIMGLTKSISPYTFLRCNHCDDNTCFPLAQSNAIIKDIPGLYGYECLSCNTRIFKKAEDIMKHTDYKEEDFRPK